MGVRLELVWDNTQVSGLGDWLDGDDQAQAQEPGWKGEEPQDGLSVSVCHPSGDHQEKMDIGLQRPCFIHP